nr:MAG TPA: hypothetical protein [Caudoviricetes sp.]
MSPPTRRPPSPPNCFPRVSGDEPLSAASPRRSMMFSPRERG